MSPLAEIFVWPFAFAAAAELAGLVGVYEHDGHMPGAFSLGTHHRDERRPPSIVDRLVQAPLGGCPVGQKRAGLGVLLGFGTPAHIPGLQVFKDDRLIAIHQFARFFVQKVLPLVADMSVVLAYLLRCFLRRWLPRFLRDSVCCLAAIFFSEVRR
jgi:hypothetical protein